MVPYGTGRAKTHSWLRAGPCFLTGIPAFLPQPPNSPFLKSIPPNAFFIFRYDGHIFPQIEKKTSYLIGFNFLSMNLKNCRIAYKKKSCTPLSPASVQYAFVPLLSAKQASLQMVPHSLPQAGLQGTMLFQRATQERAPRALPVDLFPSSGSYLSGEWYTGSDWR